MADACGALDSELTFSLLVRTLGGTQLPLNNLHATTTVSAVKQQLAVQLGTPVRCLTLVNGSDTLAKDTQTLGDAGLAVEGASVALIRVPCTQEDMIVLFSELRSAMQHNRVEEAKRLIDQGAGFDSEGNIQVTGVTRYEGDGSTVLNLAIRVSLVDLALYLISKDIAVDDASKSGMNRTPLCQAIVKGLPDVVEALLIKKASVNYADSNGRTPLDYAVNSKADDQLSKRLLLEGADFGCLRSLAYASSEELGAGEGYPPVLVACRQGLPETSLELLVRGAEWEGKDDMGRTALHWAYCRELADVVEALVKRGASKEARDNAGLLPQYITLEHMMHPPQNVRSGKCALSSGCAIQ